MRKKREKKREGGRRGKEILDAFLCAQEVTILNCFSEPATPRKQHTHQIQTANHKIHQQQDLLYSTGILLYIL